MANIIYGSSRAELRSPLVQLVYAEWAPRGSYSLLPEGQDLLDTFWVRRVHVLCLLLLYPGGGGQQCMRVILFCEKAKSFQSSTEVLRFLKKIRPTLVFVTVKDQHHFSTAAAETDNSSSPILVIEQLNRTLSSVFCSLSET